nr:zinc ribbon domain-containing protein [Candidatus Njordarchaeota archaeon]
MNITRMLVASLLMGCPVVAFVCGPPLDKALAAVTSYSTWASTYYSSWYSTSYSTQYMSTTIVTTDALSQDQLGGPYLKIAGMLGRTAPYTASFDLSITNLMDVPVLGGTIFLDIRMSGGGKEARQDFGAIEPGRSIRMEGTIGVVGGEIIAVYFVRANFNCRKSVGKEAPFATYTYSRMLTETQVKTYTTMYIVSEPFQVGATGILIAVALAGIVVVALFYVKRRRSTKPEAKSVFAVQPRSQRSCSGCGTALEPDETFCPNCGKKWA